MNILKNSSEQLINYMKDEKAFLCCDLFEIRLRTGHVYCVADFDVDVVYDNQLYRADLFLMIRDQTKIVGEPTVDTLSVTIYTDDKHEDKIENMNILKACHDGIMDGSYITLRRAYFDSDTNALVGVIELFKGRTEITQVGGLSAKLDIKSVATGLSGLYPVRIFAANKAFYESENGTIISSSTDNTTCVIPLKPSKNILIHI